MALLLYLITCAVLLLIVHRSVRPVSAVAWAALILFPFCFVGRALIRGAVYAPVDIAYATGPLAALRPQLGVPQSYSGVLGDVAYQMIPWRKAVQWALSNGEWPLWNPFILSGDILAAAGQPAAYSPFTLLAVLLPVGTGLSFSAGMVFFVAALGAFVFARELGCGVTPSLIASAGWMYSTSIAFFVLWPLAFSWAFLPFVLVGARRVVHDPSLRSGAILTVGLTLLILAGHPETVLHVVSIGCLYASVELLALRRRPWRSLAGAASAGALALLLSAVYLLPLLEAAPQTEQYHFRQYTRQSPLRSVDLVDVAARIGTDLVPLMHTRTWQMNGVIPLSPVSGAVGSIVVASAIYALIFVRSRQVWFFAALVVFGWLAGVSWTPLMKVFRALPLFDIAINDYFLFGSALALSMLGAFGVDDLIRTTSYGRAAIVYTIVLSILASATWLIVSTGVSGLNPNRWGDYKIAAEIGLLAVVVVLLLFRIPPHLLAVAILALILIQRTASESGIYPTYPMSAAYPRLPILEAMKTTRAPFRITAYNLEFIPGTSTLYELEDVRGYQAMTFAPYHSTYPLWCHHQPVWFNKVVDLTRPFLSFLNVRYAIVPTHLDPPDGWRVFAEDRTGRVLENTRVIDRVFIPNTVRLGVPATDSLIEMSRETDFRDKAWIAADVPPYERTNATGHLTVQRRGTTYHIRAAMDWDGWIVVSETAWKGWRAYIDGRRVRMTRANVAFLGVFVPRGNHDVRLVYLPESFVIGRGISFASLTGILAFAAVYAFRRKAVAR